MDQTQVIICGGGPTGALLSALLAKAQVPNIVLERDEGITTDPRGIALDEDGIRTLQSIGIYDKIFTEIGSGELSNSFQAYAHLAQR
jgi:2-polyprenyl-6-methoxyphenol hydroxylase-like FAD-dependent oxidoreductase